MEHDHSDAPLDLTAEQVAVLYRNVPIGIIATVVNATILVALEWPIVPHRTLLLWLFAMYAASGFRALLLLGYRRQRPASWRSSEWYRWSIIGSTMAAFGWGNTVWFLHPPIPLPYEMIVMFVLAGMTAGATTVLCIAVPAFGLYHLALGVPIVGHFILMGDAVHIGMAAMIGLFFIGTAHAAWNLNRAVLTSISLRIQNQVLIDSLTVRTNAVERLNEEITKEIVERRAIEEMLRTAHGDLERRIAGRTEDLQRANDDLRREVAERQRAETALRTSEARFRHLTDNLNQAVWFVQVKPYQILYLSPAFERIWGVPPERCYEDPRCGEGAFTRTTEPRSVRRLMRRSPAIPDVNSSWPIGLFGRTGRSGGSPIGAWSIGTKREESIGSAASPRTSRNRREWKTNFARRRKWRPSVV